MLHEVKTLMPHTKSDFDIDREKTFLPLHLSFPLSCPSHSRLRLSLEEIIEKM